MLFLATTFKTKKQWASSNHSAKRPEVETGCTRSNTLKMWEKMFYRCVSTWISDKVAKKRWSRRIRWILVHSLSHVSVFVLRKPFQSWECACEQPNFFLSLSATNINCLLNGSLQSFGTTKVRVLLFHLELPCGRCSFTPREKKRRNILNSITCTKIWTPTTS